MITYYAHARTERYWGLMFLVQRLNCYENGNTNISGGSDAASVQWYRALRTATGSAHVYREFLRQDAADADHRGGARACWRHGQPCAAHAEVPQRAGIGRRGR